MALDRSVHPVEMRQRTERLRPETPRWWRSLVPPTVKPTPMCNGNDFPSPIAPQLREALPNPDSIDSRHRRGEAL